MKFVPDAVVRAAAGQVMLARKNSPSLLFGAGVISMVGSTVLACRATLKLESVLDSVERDKAQAHLAKEKVESGAVKGVTYTEAEMEHDLKVISIQGITKVVKLYAPPVILGGIGILCLTKSHSILKERNLALSAAYVAVDKAFRTYRERVIDRYGEEVDRELRYDFEEIDVVDDETGKIVSTYQVTGAPGSVYSRWFDNTNPNWNGPPQDTYNWVFLRSTQNWANDMLRRRGYLVLNEVYGLLGLPHSTAGAVVGWVFDKNNTNGDNYVDFGCWDQEDNPMEMFNGREGSILLDFNVDGEIWQLIDARNARDNAR